MGSAGSSDRAQIAWLHRRAGFGFAPRESDGLQPGGVQAALDALIDPGSAGIAPAPDPWDGMTLDGYDPADTSSREGARKYAIKAIGSWLDSMSTTSQPLVEWMRWFWHGHFVSTIRVVKDPRLMVDQLRMFGRLGLGDFRSLLRAVTVDPAMLLFLDGAKSTTRTVNENFGREVLELFTLGVGNFTEADVRAGAVALTGWSVERSATEARFFPRRHDDHSQQYLGRAGVHDVDSVVDAIVANPACASFIAGKLARAVLGPNIDDAVVDDLAGPFAASGLQLRPLMRAILQAGLDGASEPIVRPPVPWLASKLRAGSVPITAVANPVAQGLQLAGQVPWNAPNVGGWPSGRAWLGSSTTLARVNMASSVAGAVASDSAPFAASAEGDWNALADALDRPDGFSAPTTDALSARRRVGGKTATTEVLALALASPDLVVDP